MKELGILATVCKSVRRHWDVTQTSIVYTIR